MNALTSRPTHRRIARLTPQGYWAVRTWLRDGTTNLMGMDAAVLNLTQFYRLDKADIRKALLDGQGMRTPLAVFRAWTGD